MSDAKNITKEYDNDFYAWTVYNAKLLREGKLSEIDIEHIAEEIESMGKSEKRELLNRLALLIAHLLKWKYQSARRSNSWKYTIKEQRLRLTRLLADSPSLKKELETKISDAYEDACYIALSETGLNEETFPVDCPFNLQNCLDQDYFPDQ